MPQKRCQECDNCIKLNNAPDAKARKKLKLSCIATKRRTEADLLSAYGRGGEFSDAPNPSKFPSPSEEKRSRPKAGAMADSAIDKELFARYSALVATCETVGSNMSKISDPIAQEYDSIIAKIKQDGAHLVPLDEVDYNDQFFIVSGILCHWKKGAPAGKTAFCPPMEYATIFEDQVARWSAQ